MRATIRVCERQVIAGRHLHTLVARSVCPSWHGKGDEPPSWRQLLLQPAATSIPRRVIDPNDLELVRRDGLRSEGRDKRRQRRPGVAKRNDDRNAWSHRSSVTGWVITGAHALPGTPPLLSRREPGPRGTCP